MRILLFILLLPLISLGQSLDSWDVVQEGYYKVVVGQDTLQKKFTRYDTALKHAYDSAENSAQGLEIKIIPPSYRFEYSYIDVDTTSVTVYDTANVEDLTLRNVNMAYQNVTGQRSLSYEAEAHGDSVLFEYFHNGQSLQKSLQYPNGGIVRDTLKDPPIDSIEVQVHGYWDKWVEPYHEIVDIAFLDTLGQTPDATDTTMSTYLHDTFTDTDGTLLENHTPDVDSVGSGWDFFTGGGTAEIQNNQAEIGGSGERAAIDAGVSGTSTTPIEFLFEWTPQAGEDNRTWCAFRYQDATNYWGVNAREPNSDVRIIETINDVSQDPDHTFPYSFTEGQTYEFKVVLDGDSITIYIDGVQELTFTDSQLQTATGYGIGNANVTTPQPFARVAVVDEGDGWPDTGGETALSGSIDSSFTLSGNVDKQATISGDITNESALSGNTIQQAALSGNINTESNLSGNLIIQALLSGELQTASELAGSVVKQMTLSGQIDSESSLSASLVKQALLSGSIDAQSALSGNVIIVDEGVVSLSGSIETQSGLSGNLTATKQIQGIIESETDLSGGVIKQVSLSGNTLTVSSLSADASIQKALASSILVSSTLSGELTPVGAAWAGTIDITNSPLYSISFEVKPMHNISIKDDPLYTINIKVKDE